MAYPRVSLADDTPQMLDEIAHLLQEDFENVALKPRGECYTPQTKEQAKSRAATSLAQFLSNLPVCSQD